MSSPPPAPAPNGATLTTVTITMTQTQVTSYVANELTLTETITDVQTVTMETVLVPEYVTATEYEPQQPGTPDQSLPTGPPVDQQPPPQTISEWNPNPTLQPEPNQSPQDGQPQMNPTPDQQDPSNPHTNPGVGPEVPFVPSAEPPIDVETAPFFDPGPNPSSSSGPSIVIPNAMQAPSKCGPNLPSCAELYYCDPQPLCAIGKECPGLCFPKFGGIYSQPEDLRGATWDKAMKEGVYRIALVVTEVRTAVPLATASIFVESVGNLTSRASGAVSSSAQTGFPMLGFKTNQTIVVSTSLATKPVRQSSVPWAPLWSGNGTTLFLRNDSRV